MNKLLLVCLLVLAPVSLVSADTKIAVIDLGKAFEQYYKTKQDNDRLQEKKAGYEKDIQDQINTYQRMGEEAQKLQDASKDTTLSQAARDDKAKALDAKKQDLITLQTKIQDMKTERSRELEDELLREHKEIVAEIFKVINDYSGPQGFDLVIDKSAISAGSGASIFIYNSSKLIDITADVIKSLNQGAPAPVGTTPSAAASTSTSTSTSTPAAPASH